MKTFLSKVISHLLNDQNELSQFCFVLPNKRAGLFLRNELRDQLNPNSFFPEIQSIDEFMEIVSGFQILDNVGLLFEFYSVFKKSNPSAEQDSFDRFSKWAHILLQDFNELDANLADALAVLEYIYEAKRIESWTTDGSEPGILMDNYLDFHSKIPNYYSKFIQRMDELHAGYQGWVYRKAAEALEVDLTRVSEKTYVFVGFNALSKSEEVVFQKLLIENRAIAYWDDDLFYNTSKVSAGSFLRQYKTNWPYYQTHEFLWSDRQIEEPKTIHFHGLPKNISQIKHTGELLHELSTQTEMKNTALVLGNEKLLPVLLNSLPKEVAEANITMGYDLEQVSLSTCLETLFRLHLNKLSRNEKRGYYYKDLQNLFNETQIKKHCLDDNLFQTHWKKLLYKDKTLFFTEQDLLGLPSPNSELFNLFQLLFTGWESSIDQVIEKVGGIIQWFREHNDPDPIETEFLFRFHTLFSQLLNYNENYGHIDSLKALHQFFRQILQMEKLSFQGEPLSGLQVMGLLESRVLDFETVILTSVNEGFLPSGKSGNSFIPFDIKLENKLPTYKEKEAIFNYHFFRLMHRAKNVFLIYNTLSDDFGSGEPSRFLKQIEVAKELGLLKDVTIKKLIFEPQLAQNPLELKIIPKSDLVMDHLKVRSAKGFSPTSLTSYIRNPLDFYKRYILGIREHEKVEASIASNTFGTIIHDSLEALYKPYVGEILTLDDIDSMQERLNSEIRLQFSKTYSSRAISSGKNYLSYEIGKQYLENFLKLEKSELQKGSVIKVLALEEQVSFLHQIPEFAFPIKLKGTIDRVDEVDGILRIVDYKTGKVVASDLNVKNIEDLITQEKFNKAFQVLIYAYLFIQNHPESLNRQIQSGIISFKNLNAKFMKVNIDLMDQEGLNGFILQLNLLFQELFDPEAPFEEKELTTYSY